ncbi:alpha/beta hydrolase [Aestuariispira insulae]|uniref:Pimeloyl-ACP methyl ester carboxylesterase n=1 Tax=Aestuariispira insulae TaxID=1461337 RepID=A0A3D9HPM6_9PROT|nr:alpha/beta hydrolase [Aestuariispira insulae]RED51422.1 pimeloyl-ACP methyl ester carboxylesterase [Aestuariispira insulae]
MTSPQPDTEQTPSRILSRDGGASIAYHARTGKTVAGEQARKPAVFFLGGFNSNMEGTKARYLDRFCVEQGLGYTRFDYQGHGQSSGTFADGTIGLWRDDALAVLDQVAEGPQILVGSSMGAWMALLLAKARPDRVAGLALIAPAPDFAQKIMWPSLPEDAKLAILKDGFWNRPSEFEDEDYPITGRLIEESRDHNLLDGDPIAFDGPVRILQGDRDEVIPVAHALATAGAVTSQDVQTTILKGGDHRLSKPHELSLLEKTILELVETRQD